MTRTIKYTGTSSSNISMAPTTEYISRRVISIYGLYAAHCASLCSTLPAEIGRKCCNQQSPHTVSHFKLPRLRNQM